MTAMEGPNDQSIKPTAVGESAEHDGEFDAPLEGVPGSEAGLSYKFQRLREKLRGAIASGELSGKLPGERALANRFHVNAKTLSKALTDLAAEGLLDRSIGRGTFVKGHAPAAATESKRWLFLCDPGRADDEIVRGLQAAHPDAEVVTQLTSAGVATFRPSYLNQFSAVIDLASDTPEAFVRGLVVRNVPVVVVGREPRTYSTHAVRFDLQLAVSQLGRTLLLGGHTRFGAVEPRGVIEVADALRSVASRYSPGDATVEPCEPADTAALLHAGVTAFVCHGAEAAKELTRHLDRLGVPVPNGASVVAVGVADNCPVSGYFVPAATTIAAVQQLLGESASARPTTLWLAGTYVDRGTTRTLTGEDSSDAAHRLSDCHPFRHGPATLSQLCPEQSA